MRLFVILLILVMQSVAMALAPEGLENFGLINQGKPSSNISSHLLYMNPRYRSDFETLMMQGGIATASNNLFTFGGTLAVGNKFTDRNSYYAKYDFLLGGSSQSLSLKYLHRDLRYISSSYEFWALEYNGAIHWGQNSGVYYSFGWFQRWLKQRWNEPSWSPFNYDTQDVDRYASVVLGLKLAGDQKSFTTYDINVRETEMYHKLDNIAFDYARYISSGANSYFRLFVSLRTTGMFVGTGAVNEVTAGLGFLSF